MLASKDPSVQPWEALCTESVYRCCNFTVLKRRSRVPHTASVHDVHILEIPDWVNIVPITRDRKVVLVRQYRHGVSSMTLEVPAGMMESRDGMAQVAARREMVEETGYDSETIEPLGFTHPNPALQNNHCHMFVARDVVRCGVPQNGNTEFTEPVIISLGDVSKLIRAGVITHALAIAAFHRLLLSETAA